MPASERASATKARRVRIGRPAISLIVAATVVGVSSVEGRLPIVNQAPPAPSGISSQPFAVRPYSSTSPSTPPATPALTADSPILLSPLTSLELLDPTGFRPVVGLDRSQADEPGAAATAPAPTARPVTPTAVPSTPVPSPGITTAVDPRVGDDYILVARARLVSLPMSGPAWDQLLAAADANAGAPNLSDMDQDNNVRVLAKSLVFARTGDPRYRKEVIEQLKAAVGTEGDTTLALGREAAAYAIAADFIGLRAADPGFDETVFRPWLRSLLSVQIDGRTLRSTHEERANNWGTHAGASRAAIAAYLGDGTELARTAQVFRGWLGDRSAYAGFDYDEDLSWQADPKAPVGINAAGSMIDGVSVDGALPEEMRRGGSFRWPPAKTAYAWGALEGAVLQAEILQRFGYDTFGWSDRALLRAMSFLFQVAQWRPEGNDQWIFWVVDARYGTTYRAAAPIPTGKNFAWSDWLYGPSS